MKILENLEPKNVFSYFEEICEIPHGSHDTKAISDYLVDFAKSRGLRYRQEECNNVIIWKDATPGYEDSATVMIQGHIDMVCEKESDCNKDMSKEGIDLVIDGDIIHAKGTTLGGDDGIAVAIALALLDSNDIEHAPLECLFTVDEEVGMTGAMELDASDLKAKYLMNIDSEEDNVLTVSCAGSLRSNAIVPVNREKFVGNVYEMTLSGLTSGHSGAEIHIGRANANILLGRLLSKISDCYDIRLINVNGGTRDNVIPAEAKAVFVVSEDNDGKQDVEKYIELLEEELKSEFKTTDPGLRLSINELNNKNSTDVFDSDSTQRVISFMYCVTDGVIKMSADVDGLVQTSSNLGSVCTKENNVEFTFLMRSSVTSQNMDTYNKMDRLAKSLKGCSELISVYSAWEYKADSRLRDVMAEVARRVYNAEPRVEAIHAGLECGILLGKMPELDCISFGPTLKNVHTPKESMYISSVPKIWELTVETLKRLK